MVLYLLILIFKDLVIDKQVQGMLLELAGMEHMIYLLNNELFNGKKFDIHLKKS